MSIFNDMRIMVTDHAVYQFSLRFGQDAPTSQEALIGFKVVIEQEVRDGLRAGRFSTKKPAGLNPYGGNDSLFVWTENEARVYALTHDEHPPQFVVKTTMRLELASA